MNWGKIISTTCYLNTNLKPVSIGERGDLYPVYVRVICKQQITRFKYFGYDHKPLLMSKKNFEQVFGNIGLKNENSLPPTNKSIGLHYVKTIKNQVEFLLNFLNAFERDDFSIKKLPLVLKNYYEIDRAVTEMTTKSIINDLQKKGYEDLIYIIDWINRNPLEIELALTDFHKRFNLSMPELHYQTLPFHTVQQLLELIRSNNLQMPPGNFEKSVDIVLSSINSKKIKGSEHLVRELIIKAFAFLNTAFQLTTK